MPRYDFKCDKCGDVQEFVIAIRSFDPEQEYPCDSCGNGSRYYKPSYSRVTTELCSRFPYFDAAADRTFNSKEQYRDYCRVNDLEDLRGVVLV